MPTGEERFLEMHLPVRCILQPFDPRACRSVLFEQASVSPARHKASGPSPPSLPLLLRPYATRARIYVCVYDVYTHRSRCIVVDFESRSIKLHWCARAHVLHQIFHAVWLAAVARGRSSKRPCRWQTHPIYVCRPSPGRGIPSILLFP